MVRSGRVAGAGDEPDAYSGEARCRARARLFFENSRDIERAGRGGLEIDEAQVTRRDAAEWDLQVLAVERPDDPVTDRWRLRPPPKHGRHRTGRRGRRAPGGDEYRAGADRDVAEIPRH